MIHPSGKYILIKYLDKQIQLLGRMFEESINCTVNISMEKFL